MMAGDLARKIRLERRDAFMQTCNGLMSVLNCLNRNMEHSELMLFTMPIALSRVFSKALHRSCNDGFVLYGMLSPPQHVA